MSGAGMQRDAERVKVPLGGSLKRDKVKENKTKQTPVAKRV